MSRRAEVLADRIEQGAAALAAFAQGLSDAEWRTVVQPDGRTVGVIIHHVASVYPIELDLARTIASGKAVSGLTAQAVAGLNAKHAHDHSAVTKQATVDLVRHNSRDVAQAIRAFTDEELDCAAPVSLNADAPLTAQFLIEDHALRHSFHHLAKIKAALKR